MLFKTITTEVVKGWGKEIIFAHHPNNGYCGKLLDFNKGGSSSMHYHALKHETFYVLSGQFKLEAINTINASRSEQTLNKGDTIIIPPNSPHRVTCLEEGVILEASSIDYAADSYRVEAGDSQK
jgi:quercetin dioxygenase-like cupin family protein